MDTKTAKARLIAASAGDWPPCDVCGEPGGVVIELRDPCQGEAFCAWHYRRFLDDRYAAMGMPVTAAELKRRAAAGVVV